MPLLHWAGSWAYNGGSRTLIMEKQLQGYLEFKLRPGASACRPITLRLGYEHRPTSVSDNSFGPVPLGDMYLYSVGLGIDQRSDAPKRKIKGAYRRLGHPAPNASRPIIFDLSFTYMTSEYHVNFNQSKLFNSTNFTDIIYNPFAV